MRRRYVFALALAAMAPVESARAGDPPADFSGTFVSLDLAYGFGAAGDWCNCTFLPPATDTLEGEGGIIVGGGLGYDVRLGSLVIEAAARASHADIKFAETCVAGACNGQASWLAEAHVGAGLIVFDNLLLAGSYGLVIGDVEAQVGGTPPSTALHDGTVLTGRIEQGMSGGWRMGVEYRRYELDGTNDTPAGEVAVDWSAEAVALVIHYELPQ